MLPTLFMPRNNQFKFTFLLQLVLLNCGQSLKHPYTLKMCISTRLLFQFCILRRPLDSCQHLRIHPHEIFQPLEVHPSQHLLWVTKQWSPTLISEPEIYKLIFRLLSCDEWAFSGTQGFCSACLYVCKLSVVPRITSRCLSVLKTGSFRISQIMEIMSGMSQSD